MNAPNLGWLYYRDLYNIRRKEIIKEDGREKEFNFSFDYLKYANTEEEKEQKKSILKDNTVVLKHRGQQFYNKKLAEYNPEAFFKCKVANSGFELTTTYPGLLCGVGYNHGISSESDFKVGFYFDHSTGLPIIPGSSVKGALRSAFPGYIRKDEEKLSKEEKEELQKRYDFFEWLIDQTNLKISDPNEKITGLKNNHKEIDDLEAFIFEGKDDKGEQFSYYQRDRFFDAYPIRSLEKDGYFLKNDYITPHINRDKPEMSPFTNPNPIQFLKVLPKVQFQFQFKLTDGAGLKAGQKEVLFKEILCYMGIGAKTNVGYGQFEEGFEDWPLDEETNTETMQKKEPSPFTGRINQNEKLEAIVVNQSKKLVKAIVKGKELFPEMAVTNCPENGTVVQVKINTVNKKNEILQVGFIRELT